MDDNKITELIILLTNLSGIARLFALEANLTHKYELLKQDKGISIKISILEE